jgi:hypothetical protein
MLHTVNIGILQHIMKWMLSFLKQHKRLDRFDAISTAVPTYRRLLKFNKVYFAVSQWTGKGLRGIVRILLPVFTATLSNPTTTEKPIVRDAILCIKAMIYIHHMAQHRSHTAHTLKYMEGYLYHLNNHDDAFHQYQATEVAKRGAAKLGNVLAKELKAERDSEVSWRGLSKAAKSRRVDNDNAWSQCQINEHLQEKCDFNFIKIHFLTHFSQHGKELGHLSNVSAE